MANKKVERTPISTEDTPVEKPVSPAVPPVRIHLKEFMMVSKLTDMEKAAFTAFTKGKTWAQPKEWQDILQSFKKRD